VSVSVALLGMSPPVGQSQPDPRFTFVEAMIPMRDGVRMHTVWFVPREAIAPLPILLERTPYGTPDRSFQISRAYPELVADGYVFAFQDVRGKYASEGTFVMLRPPRTGGAGDKVDESTDSYDTLDWLIKNVPNTNGRVGIFGVSYAGWTTTMAMLDPHPALKAVSEQASVADMFLGDDFFHNGAFRLGYALEYAYLTENAKESSRLTFDAYDTFEWFLKLGPLSNVQTKYLKDKKLPTWADFWLHPNYDAFWRQRAVGPYLTRVTVPTLNVAGWWDQEDFFGPLRIYRALEAHDVRSENFLVVGPWNHGGWRSGRGQMLGNIDFGSATGEHFRAKIEAPFFARYLKDRTFQQADATVFESGSNTWRTFSAWPPRGTKTRIIYLGADRRLSFEPPLAAATTRFDSYVSDPHRPVPYRTRPIEATFGPDSRWPTWLVQDQRFVQDRPDALSWETEPLAEDVVVAGEIVAKLFVSVTGRDADFIVKLIDVYPQTWEANSRLGGYQLMIANDVLRARFRNSFEKPEPMVPGAVTPLTIDLHSQSYRFRTGHKVMVQVQSTWFPLIDRNPQTWTANIFDAKAGDYQSQTHRIWRTPAYPSRIEFATPGPE
jgi:putative CocE/NonD family hydrolase